MAVEDPNRGESPDCRDPGVGRLLGRFDAGLCSEEEREAFAGHLLVCTACGEFERATRGGWGDLVPVRAPSGGRLRLLLGIATAAAVLLSLLAGGWVLLRPSLPRADGHFASARAFRGKDNLPDALGAVEAALEEFRSPTFLCMKGEILREMGRSTESVEVLEEARKAAEPKAAPWPATSRENLNFQYALSLAEDGRRAEADRVAAERLETGDTWDLHNRVTVLARIARRCFAVDGDREAGDRYLDRARALEEQYQALPADLRGAMPRNPHLLLLEIQVANLVLRDSALALAHSRSYLAFSRHYDEHEKLEGKHLADGMNTLAAALLGRYRDTGDAELLDEAAPLLSRSLILRHKFHSLQGEVWALTNLGMLDMARGRPEDAEVHLLGARDRAASLPGGVEERASIHIALGHIRMGLRRWSEAEGDFRAAVPEARAAGGASILARALEGILLSARRTGSTPDPAVLREVEGLLPRLLETGQAARLATLAAAGGPLETAEAEAAAASLRPLSTTARW